MVKSVDSNMNKKGKKKKEEEPELPSKKKRIINMSTQTYLNNLPLSSMHKCSLCAVIPYHITISTGLERDASTTSRAYVIIIGANHTQTERLWLDLLDGRQGFEAGSLESFESYGSDVGEIKKVEVREEDWALSRIHKHTHTNTQNHTPTLLEVIVFLPACSSAMMGPLLRAAGWLMSCLLPCQPKGSNMSLLANAGWPKIEEMV